MTRSLLLLLSASVLIMAESAQAQTSYSAGSTTYSQPSSATFSQGPDALPNLSPDRIAADVRTEFNPRTGAREKVAPTFDPFELDEGLAGSVNLRSTDMAFDLNGQPLQGGVLLQIDLYYNDEGDRDFGRTRDALFLNGEVVPIVRRDSRELECSSRVTETIYAHDRFYSPGYGGIYRPRPIYRGHFGFDFGGYHGYGYGPGYRDFRDPYIRPRRPRPRPYPRRRPDPGPRPVTPPVTQPDAPVVGAPVYDDNGRRRLGTDYMRNGVPAGSKPADPTTQPPPRRPRRPRGADTERPRGGSAVRTPEVTRPVPRRPERPRRRPAPADTPATDRPAPVITPPTAAPKRDTRPPVSRVRPRTDPAIRRDRPTETRPAPAPRPRATPTPRPTPRPTPPPMPRSSPPPTSRPAPPPRRTAPPPERARVAPPPRTRGGGRAAPEQLQLFPGDGYSDSVVVRTQWDCAREDQLYVFIPDERLEAARFDGLTLILRDVTHDPRQNQTTVYDERPLYVPPNYIEGFLIAKRQP